MARLSPARKGDHTQMLLSANDMEAVLGSEVMNGIETLEHRIRTCSMDVIAEGRDLLGNSLTQILSSQLHHCCFAPSH